MQNKKYKKNKNIFEKCFANTKLCVTMIALIGLQDAYFYIFCK